MCRLLAFLILSAQIAAFAADEAPQWMRDAAAATLPAYGPKVSAVVLLRDRTISIDETGKALNTVRFAIKVLNKEGARYASGAEVYTTDTDKVRDFKAWLIYPSGKVKRFGKEEILDIAVTENDIYNEARYKTASASRESDPGAIFGYESVIEEKSLFTQFGFEFQNSLPAVKSSLTLTLPASWTAEAQTFNHAKIEPKTSASGNYLWELSNLPHVEAEDLAPSGRALSPRISVTYFPTGTQQKPFSSWEDVSTWLAGLNDTQVDADEAIRAKALELTSGAKSEFEKIQALGRFAQALTYVSIQTGTGRGGGYKPHSAAQVFQKRYGDCKDKANLLRSMLKTVGITAYPVAIYSGDRNYVNDSWPSPHQFNHAISAISVSAAVTQPSVTVHPKLGRLLFFDSTDPYTPVGSLPEDEQDSFALVVDSKGGGLMKAPSARPDPDTWTRTVEATLDAEGGVQGKVVEHRTGEASGRLRARYKGLSPDLYRRTVERWITSGVRGAVVENLKTEDGADSIAWSAQFKAPRFAQSPQAKLMIFRAGVIQLLDFARFTEKTRKLPIVLGSDAVSEIASVKLPEGFQIDELPDPIKIDSPYGKIDASWKADGGTVTFVRKIAINAATVPAAEYAALKRFLDTANGASEQPVVLIRR